MPRFVGVEHGLGGQGPLEFLVGPDHGGTCLFPGMLGTAHADRYLERAFKHALHDQARHPADHREIRNQRRELRTKLPLDLNGQRRLRRLAARRTAPSMAAIFGNVRLDGRQLGDLMPSRVADLIARVQGMLAMTTRVGDERHGRIHALGGDQPSPMTWMTWLPTTLPATLRAATPFALASGQSVGGRRLRGRGRVLLPQGQLVFQVGNLLLSLRDLLRPLGQLPIAFSNLALQPTILALQPLALGFRALGALAPLGSRAAWLILVTSRGHTTVMADSDKKYKYKILDQHKRATPP